MPADTLAAAIFIAFLASFCMSTTGFGFALVMAPLLTLAWNVKEAVAASVLLSFMNQGPLIFEVRAHVVPRRVIFMVLGFFTGLPLGLYLFDALDADALKGLVAVTVIIASISLFVTPEFSISDRRANPLGLAAGLIAGSVGASTSINGPPVIFYLLGRHTEIEEFRATILTFFMSAGVVMVSAFAILGRFTEDVLIVAGAAIPAMLAGMLLGRWLRKRLEPERFRTLVLGILVASSAGILASLAL